MVLSTPVSYQLHSPKWWAFDAHVNLPLKPDHLWRIESGVVRTHTWLEDGTVITLGLWGTGEVVSKTLATIKPYQVESLTEVRATLLPISQHPDVTTMLISQIQQMNELAVIRSHKTVEMMLIKLLGWLAQKFGREMNKGQLIDVRLTHQDLADLLASSRVTITRTLSQLEQQGVIQRHPLHRILLREEDVWHYEI